MSDDLGGLNPARQHDRSAWSAQVNEDINMIHWRNV